MSTTSSQLIELGAINAEKSLASYATLTPDMLRSSMINNLVKEGMTTVQATAFADKYRVVAQTDTGWGGSLTVFEERGTDPPVRSVSVRGTELSDPADLVIGDAALAVGIPRDCNPTYTGIRDQVASWIADGTLPQYFTVDGHSFGG